MELVSVIGGTEKKHKNCNVGLQTCSQEVEAREMLGQTGERGRKRKLG